MIKKLIFKLKGIKLPYELKKVWLSRDIPARKKFMGRVLRLKAYPNQGDIVYLFDYKGKKAYYKVTEIERYELARSAFADLAYWDNGKEYSFVFDHLVTPPTPLKAL